MHARMTVARPLPDRLDDAIALTREVFASAAREQQGYRGFLLFVDRGAQQLTGVSLWTSAADRQASAGSGGYYQDGVAAFMQLLTAPPITTDVEVAIHDVRDA